MFNYLFLEESNLTRKNHKDTEWRDTANERLDVQASSRIWLHRTSTNGLHPRKVHRSMCLQIPTVTRVTPMCLVRSRTAPSIRDRA